MCYLKKTRHAMSISTFSMIRTNCIRDVKFLTVFIFFIARILTTFASPVVQFGPVAVGTNQTFFTGISWGPGPFDNNPQLN